MSRRTAAVGTAVIFATLSWLVLGLVDSAYWGCDEGVCSTPASWVAVRWGVSILVAGASGVWGARRAERTRRARGASGD